MLRVDVPITGDGKVGSPRRPAVPDDIAYSVVSRGQGTEWWRIELSTDDLAAWTGGFLDALDDLLGAEHAETLLSARMLSLIQRGRWEKAWQRVADLKESGDLSDDDVAAIEALADEHNIPREGA